jgi:hypothetical protein
VAQAALNAGNPVALTRLPPELADAAAALWEHALRLSQQTALVGDNAARVRERALADAREQIGRLMTELSADRTALRARDRRIVDLESQLDEQRREVEIVIARAIAKNRTLRTPIRRRPRPPKKKSVVKKKERGLPKRSQRRV